MNINKFKASERKSAFWSFILTVSFPGERGTRNTGRTGVEKSIWWGRGADFTYGRKGGAKYKRSRIGFTFQLTKKVGWKL